MVVLHQLKLSIEEAHGPNNGHAEGGGENNFVEHLFLVVYDLGLRQIISICSCRYKPEWSENRQARPTGSNQLCCSRSRRKSTSKPASTNNLAAPGTQKLSHCNNISLISLVVNIAAIPS